jgi:SAM-dependent methyltransferase
MIGVDSTFKAIYTTYREDPPLTYTPLETKGLLYSQRPLEIQQKVDEWFLKAQEVANRYRRIGDKGFYHIFEIPDSEMIDRQIKEADPKKKELYFIDLGSGKHKWVDAAKDHLSANYSQDTRHFHVIGVTAHGNTFDEKQDFGNITTHKIGGFKLECLVEEFRKLNLPIENQAEFIVCSFVLPHLFDPIGTLDQAYHLLTPGNGFLFAFAVDMYLDERIDPVLFHTVGSDNYIIREEAFSSHGGYWEGPLFSTQFGLFRPKENSTYLAKNAFSYGDPPIIHPPGDRIRSNLIWPDHPTSEPKRFGETLRGESTKFLDTLFCKNENNEWSDFAKCLKKGDPVHLNVT